MAYNKTLWENSKSPYINASNLNKIEQGIYDNSNIIEGIGLGETAKGEWTPTAGTEYPVDPVLGDSWFIGGLSTPYLYTGGDLVGQTTNNQDKIYYTSTGWILLEASNVPTEIVKYVDTIADIPSVDHNIYSTVNVKGYYVPNDGGGGIFNYDATQVGENNGGTIFDGWVRQYNKGAVWVEWFGAKGDGVEDDTLAIQNAVDHCGVSGERNLNFGNGTFMTDGITKTFNTLNITGSSGGRPTALNEGGTRLEWTGLTGALIENGVDDGLPWDDPIYDGPQNLRLMGLNLYNGSANRTTSLNCTGSLYGIDSYGVRDWRGGHIIIEDCFIEGFEYSLWAINSDFNKITDVTQAYSKYGIYMGPRSDQSVFIGLYSFYCDTVFIADTSSNHNIQSMFTVLCGSDTDYVFRVYKGASNIIITQPWIENYGGVVDCLPFYDIGLVDGYGGNTDAVLGVEILSPIIAVQTQGSSGPNELVEVTKAERVTIREPEGARGTTITSNLRAYFYIRSGVTGTGFDLNYIGQPTSKYMLNEGTGIPNITTYETSSGVLIGSQTGRFSIVDLNGVGGADEIRISQSNLAGRIQFETPNYVGFQIQRLDFRRILHDRDARPTTGAYELGDYVRNTSPSVLGTGGSQYIVQGWTRITSGTSNVLNTDWVESRSLTGT